MMHAALRGEDLNALGEALKARRAALEAGDSPTLEDFQAGEFALAALAAIKRCWAYESARLEQVRLSLMNGVVNQNPFHFDLRA